MVLIFISFILFAAYLATVIKILGLPASINELPSRESTQRHRVSLYSHVLDRGRHTSSRLARYAPKTY